MAKLIQFPGKNSARRALKKAGRKTSRMEAAGQMNMFDQSQSSGQVIKTYANAFARALQLDETGSDHALDAYREAVKKEVRPSDALTNIATIQAEKGLVHDAIESLSEAIVINPKNGLAHYNMGNIYLDSGNLSLAKLHYEQAMRFEPELLEAQFNLALVLLIKGDRSRALDLLKQYEEITSEQIDLASLIEALGTGSG